MQKKTKKILLWVLGVWVALGLISVLGEFISQNAAKEKPTEKTQAATAPAAEQKPAVQYLRPGVSNDVKIRNALIRNYDGGYRSDTPFGWRQIVSLAPDEWKSVTGTDLLAFFNAVDFSGGHELYFLERGGGYTGRGLLISQNGKFSSLGEFDTDNLNDIKKKSEARQFFYYADEKRIQYFNASDSDDEPLRDLQESDNPLLW